MCIRDRGDYAKAQGEAAHEAASGDASDRTVNTFDAVTDEFPVIGNGKKLRNLFGTLKKFCEDFNNIRNGLITVGKLINDGLCTEEGYALDARFGKILKDQLDKQNSDLAVMVIGNKKIIWNAYCVVTTDEYGNCNIPFGYTFADNDIFVIPTVAYSYDQCSASVREINSTGFSVSVNVAGQHWINKEITLIWVAIGNK